MSVQGRLDKWNVFVILIWVIFESSVLSEVKIQLFNSYAFRMCRLRNKFKLFTPEAYFLMEYACSYECERIA